jgi:hypothetical protein
MTGPSVRPLYTVRRVEDFGPERAASGPWAGLAPLQIDHYLWLDNGYRPRVQVRLGWSSKFLYVRFDVDEAQPLVRFTTFQDPVYKDSCVEFFVDMVPAARRGYVNFEANAAGTLLAAIGPDRSNRTPLWPEDLAEYGVDVARSGTGWTLVHHLPLGLFRKLYGRDISPGHRAAANFYKCGDETAVPHYGAWSPVDTPRPDFHRPEFFGELIFA